MPTWLTGLLVTVRIARSASDRPRNSQTSPVDAVATASSSESGASGTGRVGYGPSMRVPWKIVGLAGLAGVAAGGAVVARRRRAHVEVEPDELRERLQRRLDEAANATPSESQPRDDEPRAF